MKRLQKIATALQTIEAVNEDKRRLKLNGSVAQGESLSESSVTEGKEKVETLAASYILGGRLMLFLP
ncbi:unnamed protein product [Brassica rapa subsp. narinosa]|uniref:(rape) hypothetical protein n=1 Tax=Brassica napus TaxID=3708 RepID=A0A816VBN6_BRANA|nr:unnamed protein product [Brassica napus]